MTSKPTWKLKKTLARKLDFRPIEAEDVQYAWAAYRSGAFEKIFPEGLSAAEFKQTFEHWLVGRYDAAWTLFAESKKGFLPVGFLFGFWPHPLAGQFMIANAFVWFPWSTKRNRIESAVNVLNSLRMEMPMLGFARPRDKEFVEMMARHGIVRRVGTSSNVFGDEPASVWETRNG